LFGLFGLLLIGVLAAGSVSAFGWRHDEEATQALEDGDYDAWREARLSELTEENFETMRSQYADREEQRETMDAIKTALEAGDYDEWKDLIESLDDYPLDVETFTEEDFDILVQMHEARQSGDLETVEELADELGFETPFGLGPFGSDEGFGRSQHGQGRNGMFGARGETKAD